MTGEHSAGVTPRGSKSLSGVLIVLALFAGWYAVALGWSAVFLLDESVAMAVFAAVLFAAPVLFTIAAILVYRARYGAALWLLLPLFAKWVAASVWAFQQGGLSELLLRLPGVSLVTMLTEGFQDTYPIDQFILLILQFQVEPLATVVVVGMLFLRRKRIKTS